MRAKLIIYRAFIESDLEVPKHLARPVHDLYFSPQQEEFQSRTLWSLGATTVTANVIGGMNRLVYEPQVDAVEEFSVQVNGLLRYLPWRLPVRICGDSRYHRFRKKL